MKNFIIYILAQILILFRALIFMFVGWAIITVLLMFGKMLISFNQ